MSALRGVALVAAFAVTALAGCALVSAPEPETHKQVINKVPEGLPKAQPHAATLVVLVPETPAPYDTTEMAYTTRPYQVEYFARNEWSEKPARMIQSLLARSLRETGYFKEVHEAPYAGPSKYALRSELVELRQDFSSGAPTLRIALRLQLVDSVSDKVVASREIVEQEPMREKSPYAGVVAANEATARLLLEAVRFVLRGAG